MVEPPDCMLMSRPMVEPSSGRAVQLHANERDLRPYRQVHLVDGRASAAIALALLHLHHALLAVWPSPLPRRSRGPHARGARVVRAGEQTRSLDCLAPSMTVTVTLAFTATLTLTVRQVSTRSLEGVSHAEYADELECFLLEMTRPRHRDRAEIAPGEAEIVPVEAEIAPGEAEIAPEDAEIALRRLEGKQSRPTLTLSADGDGDDDAPMGQAPSDIGVGTSPDESRPVRYGC